MSIEEESSRKKRDTVSKCLYEWIVKRVGEEGEIREKREEKNKRLSL